MNENDIKHFIFRAKEAGYPDFEINMLRENMLGLDFIRCMFDMDGISAYERRCLVSQHLFNGNIDILRFLLAHEKVKNRQLMDMFTPQGAVFHPAGPCNAAALRAKKYRMCIRNTEMLQLFLNRKNMLKDLETVFDTKENVHIDVFEEHVAGTRILIEHGIGYLATVNEDTYELIRESVLDLPRLERQINTNLDLCEEFMIPYCINAATRLPMLLPVKLIRQAQKGTWGNRFLVEYYIKSRPLEEQVQFVKTKPVKSKIEISKNSLDKYSVETLVSEIDRRLKIGKYVPDYAVSEIMYVRDPDWITRLSQPFIYMIKPSERLRQLLEYVHLRGHSQYISYNCKFDWDPTVEDFLALLDYPCGSKIISDMICGVNRSIYGELQLFTKLQNRDPNILMNLPDHSLRPDTLEGVNFLKNLGLLHKVNPVQVARVFRGKASFLKAHRQEFRLRNYVEGIMHKAWPYQKQIITVVYASGISPSVDFLCSLSDRCKNDYVYEKTRNLFWDPLGGFAIPDVYGDLFIPYRDPLPKYLVRMIQAMPADQQDHFFGFLRIYT